MALTKEQYQAFEAIVGPENISDDPVDLDAWAWRSGQAAMAQDFKPRFEAILMPGSTEEVQAIVRLCNRLGVQFKASSTGWGVYCDAGGPGCIKLDLRRMNRIIEINEENMYAVVEPYVIHAQLQAELMKRGFTCNVNGAGGITSAMPLAAHEGIGHMSGTCSISERNLLALEWVTPEGELIQTGSLAELGEWFCADGPGPSLRGLVRGTHRDPFAGGKSRRRLGVLRSSPAAGRFRPLGGEVVVPEPGWPDWSGSRRLPTTLRPAGRIATFSWFSFLASVGPQSPASTSFVPRVR